ncbi:oxidoreductase [Lottiidibacillus patelloidae]|uniref:Oxidoreductase n=1 Tax=Lottiidibacillus patelloidae TaxID=2670334 RepID=A0A263BSP8_9BACI|nr:aldo/keto reductase [Lottiidibacillus patelloidae]OZM56602.1 oxidoreductase [Lottiidibacillus patelloidae]
MKKRLLGNTGIEVSEIGFGAWQLGNEKDWGKMTESEAVYLVDKAIDLGCNFFDTAPNYGAGKSEELLGKAFKGKRNQVVISSKCGHHSNGEENFAPDKLILSVENSLRRLKTEYLDSLLLHNPPFSTLDSNSQQFEVLEKLKKQGKIRLYGASVDNSSEINQLVANTDSQIIEVMFNILYQEPVSAIQTAQNQGVGIIAKIPLDSGWLTGKYSANSTFSGIRSRWSEEEIKKRGELVDQVRQIVGRKTSMVKAALHFILSYKEVSTVIPGARNVKQLAENISASEFCLSKEVLKELKELWDKEIKNSKLSW